MGEWGWHLYAAHRTQPVGGILTLSFSSRHNSRTISRFLERKLLSLALTTSADLSIYNLTHSVAGHSPTSNKPVDDEGDGQRWAQTWFLYFGGYARGSGGLPGWGWRHGHRCWRRGYACVLVIL